MVVIITLNVKIILHEFIMQSFLYNFIYLLFSYAMSLLDLILLLEIDYINTLFKLAYTVAIN